MNLVVCVITLILTLLMISNFHEIEAAGFSIDLIHRDSIQSPSLRSSFERIAAMLRRSFNRAETLIPANYSQKSSATTEISPDSGEYLMKFSVGTPKVETLAVADTGSDLTWIQCKPCKRCYKQRSPLFVSGRSSTYKQVPCRSAVCKSITTDPCVGTNGGCSYSVRYGDNSFSAGDVAIEAITLGQNFTFPHIVIGCGHMSGGIFAPAASGIVGLGGGKESLVRQMGSSIGGRFSYCLAPLPSSSKPSRMHFGDAAKVAGAGVVTTPIVTKFKDTYYFLTLLGMSVGRQRFDINSVESAKLRGGWNIVIDSGTTLSFLPRDLYGQVEAEMKRQVGLKQISDPQKKMKLCYLATADAERKIPEVTAHFRGGDVKLKSYNTFVRTSKKALCFTFAPASLMPIYGNLAQMDFLIGFDLVKKTVSFKPTDCTNSNA